ncbi:2-amino-4-hydroxy-6-hydroxymethyldihydropteridine pyrophosphokinase [Paracoccus halophilus]|uniref:2-amino-4-hydroxy-6-hydroxymethyldihydropteridine pyrophosphokinase n=1 Tax=Paracoccus halophilus TaxID=376733 RepID=A0A099F0E4_9RHOB|nr:2-amino-4-hydroxy-6-hydroxymethyldihydropteridine pyrophosphokinase [Paracoccus halophilus]
MGGLNQNANLALLALGANLPSSAGPPELTLRKALAELGKHDAIQAVAISRFWRTPAFPAGSGPDYVNAAAVFACQLEPEALLAQMHRVEAAFGRRRAGLRWQARGLDLDLLAFGDRVLPDAATQDGWRALPLEQQAQTAPEGLVLPHPRLQERGFVLAPLAEIAPGWCHPRLGRTVAELLAALPQGALDGMKPAHT